MLKQFYVYLWLRTGGTPYYVGKGTGRRGFKQSGHRVRKPSSDHILVEFYASEQDALFAEMFLIAAYGRMDQHTGCLANLTDGGEGPVGMKHSLETRKLWSQQRCENPSSGFTGLKHDEGFGITIANANQHRIWSSESIERLQRHAQTRVRVGGRFVKTR